MKDLKKIAFQKLDDKWERRVKRLSKKDKAEVLMIVMERSKQLEEMKRESYVTTFGAQSFENVKRHD